MLIEHVNEICQQESLKYFGNARARDYYVQRKQKKFCIACKIVTATLLLSFSWSEHNEQCGLYMSPKFCL